MGFVEGKGESLDVDTSCRILQKSDELLIELGRED
jgi:hypothetical protein